uniref:Ig-like domain-containing protein n=1 Tax=Macrostomum lignano TaxID=282301 RepID=A0A1I8HMB6_9PLAT
EVSRKDSTMLKVGLHEIRVEVDLLSRDQRQSANVTCSVKQDYAGFKSSSLVFLALKADESFQASDQEMVGVAIVLSISLPATVYVWRRTASPPLGIQWQHRAATDRRPADVPLVPTVYYYEENPALPDRPPSVEETDSNMVHCSEEEQTAQGAVEFYVQ